LIIPPGFGEAPTAMSGPNHPGVTVFFDETTAPEADILIGLLQMAAGRNVFEEFLGLAPAEGRPPPRTLVHVDRRGVSLSRMSTDSRHTFLAAIVPMFLLFLSAGSGRTLLLEISGGAIRRQLAAPIQPWQIVGGQMLFCFLLAMAQCYVMYVYAWLVFGVPIGSMGWPLLVLTAVTCLATTGLGLLIGSICRDVEQLDAIGMVVCLAMSAIGGSMVPRWIMPEYMKKLGLLTINGWAYDGYLAIIRNEGLRGIFAVCAVLLAMAAAFAGAGSAILTRRLRA
jgi:ABC-2 type transport system permease protein